MNLADIRTKFKVYAEDDTISNTVVDTYFNDAYLEFYGYVKGTGIMEEYASTTEETTTVDDFGSYISITIAGLIGYKLFNNSVKNVQKSSTTYKVYLKIPNTEVYLTKYTQVSKLSETTDETIFSNEAIDNLVIYLSVAKYFEHNLNQPEKADRLRQIARTGISELSTTGFQQEQIINPETRNYTEPSLNV